METLLGDGTRERPGIVFEVKDDLKTIKELVMKARFVILGWFMGIMAMLFMSGAGTVSLKTLIEVLK